MDNILKYLEKTAERFPDKTAVDDGTVQFTYQELLDKARHFGLSFLDKTMPGRPVAILREKSSEVLAAMFGIVYAGCFYVMIDPEQPLERLKDILSVLKTDLVLTDSTYKNQLEDAGYQGEIYLLDQERTEASLTEQDVEKLMERRSTADSTDLLYGIFTSGSTGKPKCVAVSQQAVIDFIGHFTKQFEITDQDRIANQAPFDFDVSVKDIYSAITTGATLVLVPKRLFSLPPRLLDYLCDKKVTVMVWAVSALCLISSLKGLKYKIPEDARIIMFSGEVMPVKQMRLWQQALPQTKFINLYGPSEITCNCTWYPVEREFQDGEVIPAGRAFDGRTVFLLDETGADITESGKTGEICVAGESLADGYYHNEEETARRFVTGAVPGETGNTRFYRTGDLGYFGEDENLYFAGRKDFQIKHMGHRIELGEIETALETVEGLGRSLCMYDEAKGKILAFYEGDLEKKQIVRAIGTRLPGFMIPNVFVKVEEFPLTKNGKIDRKKLEETYESGNLTSLS